MFQSAGDKLIIIHSANMTLTMDLVFYSRISRGIQLNNIDLCTIVSTSNYHHFYYITPLCILGTEVNRPTFIYIKYVFIYKNNIGGFLFLDSEFLGASNFHFNRTRTLELAAPTINASSSLRLPHSINL